MPKSHKPRKQRKIAVRPAAQLVDHLRRQPPVCHCEFHATVKRLLSLRGGNWYAWPARQV